MGDNDSVRYSGLIEGARQGDAGCRERLFELCRSYLGFVARSQVETWLRRKVDASDLVQETMLEAYRDFGRFEGRAEQEWLAWLRKISSPEINWRSLCACKRTNAQGSAAAHRSDLPTK